jgi:hypothetical protein
MPEASTDTRSTASTGLLRPVLYGVNRLTCLALAHAAYRAQRRTCHRGRFATRRTPGAIPPTPDSPLPVATVGQKSASMSSPTLSDGAR